MKKLVIEVVGEDLNEMHEFIEAMLSNTMLESWTEWGTRDGYTVDMDELPKKQN